MTHRILRSLVLAAVFVLPALAAPGDSLGVPSIPNLRDAGGYTTTDGATLRTGLLYRSNQLHGVSEEDRAKLAALGLVTDYDLRTPDEIAAKPDEIPDGVAMVALDVSAGTDRSALKAMVASLDDPVAASAAWGGGKADALLIAAYRDLVSSPGALAGYRGLFLGLGEPGHLPAIMHCTAGKDRTGWAAAALLTLLGVDRETVIADYLRSNDNLSLTAAKRIDDFVAKGGDREVIEVLMKVKRQFLEAAFAEMEARYGGIEGYFADGLGIDAAGQQKLRAVFLTRS